MAPGSVRAVTRWTSRIIPIILAGCAAFSSYVVSSRICVDYLLRTSAQPAAAITVLSLHVLFLGLMVACYLRLLIVINTDPGVVPLGPIAARRRDKKGRIMPTNPGADLEAQQYDAGPDMNPDSPGLERFYSKDMFVCAPDGRPIWCSSCGNWKPDRAHHSSEMERCVRKMDHYCPWVGGIVSETSFKYFFQFTLYASIYCAIDLAVAAYSLGQQVSSGLYLDSFAIGVIALAGWFGLFTFLMTATSLRFILTNMTNVDVLRHKSKVYQLAIRVPRGSPATSRYSVVVYPLPNPNLERNGCGATQTSDSSEGTSPRDRLASRTYAIVKTERGENPWQLGLYQNWLSIMGTNIIDWLLPIRESPCCGEESSESFYRMGPLCANLRARYGLPDLPEEEHGIEMGGVGRANA